MSNNIFTIVVIVLIVFICLEQFLINKYLGNYSSRDKLKWTYYQLITVVVSYFIVNKLTLDWNMLIVATIFLLQCCFNLYMFYKSKETERL